MWYNFVEWYLAGFASAMLLISSIVAYALVRNGNVGVDLRDDDDRDPGSEYYKIVRGEKDGLK